MMRFLVLLLAFAGSAVMAQGTATITQYETRSLVNSAQTATGWRNSQSEACVAAGAVDMAYYASNTGMAPWSIQNMVSVGTCSYDVYNKNGPTHAGPYSYTSQANVAALPCPTAGTVATRNFTVGYASSSNSDGLEFINNIPDSGSTHNVVGGGSTCVAVVGPVSKCWASTQPNPQGLYRYSCDHEVTFSGASGTATADEKKLTDTSVTPATCSGAYGTVNGRPTCVSTVPKMAYPPAVAAAPTSTGNPPAGSNGGDSLANRAPTSGANNDNAGSTTGSQDGITVTRGAGLPSNGGTTAATSAGASGIQKADLQDIKTDCDKKPNAIGCGEYGSADSGPSLPSSVAAVGSVVAASFASSAVCPGDMPFSVMGHTYAISYTPICNASTDYVRPVVLVLAAASAAFIFIGGLKA